jgi:hypothetical protein
MAIKHALDALIAQGKDDFVLRLKGDHNLLGPGKIEELTDLRDQALVTLPNGTVETRSPSAGIYRILACQQVQTSAQNPPRLMIVPITFSVDDVLVIIEPPMNVEGETSIITPGQKTRGGIVIPGSS